VFAAGWFELPAATTSWWIYLAGFVGGWLLLWRRRTLPPSGVTAGAAPDRPSVAVVIPARNEVDSLAAVLVPILEQLRPGDELVVVDDHSTDGTAARARELGAQVVPAPDLPEGWAGKPHACAVGAQSTSAPLLVFLDADVAPPLDLLDRLAAEVDRSEGALVSVQPWHRTERVYEQLSLVFNLAALMGTAAFTPLGARASSPMAFGPVLACRRDEYDEAGGHAHPQVRAAVAEDLALAEEMGSVALFVGAPHDLTFRMYPAGVRSLVQGWTKNIATGADRARWWVTITAIVWIGSLVGGPFTSFWMYVASALQMGVLGRRAGRYGVPAALMYPLLTAFFLFVFLRSTALTILRRDVSWKGRRLPSRS
jgi:4,4'-diaponeurosporenoate glycosyltransferase